MTGALTRRLGPPALQVGAIVFFGALFALDLWQTGRFAGWAPIRVIADLLLFGTVTGWVILRTVQSRELGHGPLDLALAVFVAVAALSSVQARDPALAVEPLLFAVAVVLWFKLLEQEVGTNRRGGDWLLGLVLAGSAVFAVQGLVAFSSWYAGIPSRGLTQVSWLDTASGLVPFAIPSEGRPQGGSVGIAYLAMLSAPAAGWLAATHRRQTRVLLVGWLLLAAISLLLLQSRSAWVATATGFAVLLFLLTRSSTLKRFWVLGAITIAVLLITLLFFSTGTRASTTLTRLFIWSDAVGIWKEAPLFGVGPGNYPLAQLYHRTGVPFDDIFLHTHNLAVQVLVVLGICGFTVGLWILATLALRLIDAWQATGPQARPRVAGYAGGLAAFLAWNLTEVQTHSFLLWGTSGILVVLGLNHGREAAVVVGGLKLGLVSPWYRFLQFGLASGLVLALVLVESEHLLLHRAGLMTHAGQWDGAVETMRASAAVSPMQGFYQWELGLAKAQLGRWAEADAAYGRADLVRGWPAMLANSAYAALQAGDPGRAIDLAMRAQRLRPNEARYALFLGLVYEQAGHTREATQAYGRALALEPSWLGSRYWELRSARVSRREALEAAISWAASSAELVDPQRHRYQAELFLAAGRPTEAESVMRQALAGARAELTGEISMLLTGEARDIYVRERALFSHGDGPGATYSLLGRAVLDQGDWAGAEEFFAQAIQHAPAYVPARLGASVAASQRGDHESAIRDARLAVAFAGGRSASAALGTALLRAGRAAEAVPHLEAGSQVQPFYSSWYGLLLYQRRELLPNLLPQIPELTPDNELAAVLRDLAIAYGVLGDEEGQARVLARMRSNQRDRQH